MSEAATEKDIERLWNALNDHARDCPIGKVVLKHDHWIEGNGDVGARVHLDRLVRAEASRVDKERSIDEDRKWLRRLLIGSIVAMLFGAITTIAGTFYTTMASRSSEAAADQILQKVDEKFDAIVMKLHE